MQSNINHAHLPLCAQCVGVCVLHGRRVAKLSRVQGQLAGALCRKLGQKHTAALDVCVAKACHRAQGTSAKARVRR